MVCGACNKPCSGTGILGTDYFTCCKCSSNYHALCLNLSRDDHKLMRTKKQFICPECKLKTKNVKSDSTPVRPKLPEATSNREGGNQNNLEPSPRTLPSFDFSPEATSAFTAAIKELCDTVTSMKNEMSEFTRSLNFFSQELSTLREELAVIKKEQKETEKYKAEVASLRAEVAELRQLVTSKEQQQLLKNIEISGLPEFKSENLLQTVHVIAAKLGLQLDPHDVDDVKRMGKRGENQQRPRPVVLTLTRRATRDLLLKAARVRRGLTTDKLEMPGPPSKLYLNEHLTKENRILFSKARKLGSELRYKHTWTSYGHIFMRRTDTSSITHIASEDVLQKLNRQPRPVEDGTNNLSYSLDDLNKPSCSTENQHREPSDS